MDYQSVLKQCKGDESLAKQVWRKIILNGKTQDIKKFVDWLQVATMFDNDEHVMQEALVQMSKLAKRFDHWMEIYDRCPAKFPGFRAAALEKMAEKARTFDHWRMLYNYVSEDSELSKMAISKMARLAK